MPRGGIRRRRGSVYALVLGIAILVTVVGIGALSVTRLNARAATASDDWNEAGILAFSACEQALAKLNTVAAAAPYTWRASYTSGTPVAAVTMGRGTYQWELVDPSDANLANDYTQSFTLYGIGRVGKATRVYSVTVNAGGTGIDALRAAYHAGTTLTVTGTTTVTGGPASCNGRATLNANLRGDLEAGSKIGTGTYGAGSVIPAAAKSQPSINAFEYYKAKATSLPGGAVSGNIFQPGTLTPSTNPYSGSTNADGVYYLRLPNVSSITINPSRIIGTLIIEGHSSSTAQSVTIQAEQYWQPYRSDYPVLLVKDVSTFTINGSMSRLSQSGNYYPSEIRGLIHLSETTNVILGNGCYIYGALITDNAMTTSGTNAVTNDPKIIANPPFGYQKGDVLTPAPGTWKWDVLP